MRRVLVLLVACSKSAAPVHCGSGTELRNGVCEVITAPVPKDAAVTVDAAPIDAPSTGWRYEEGKDDMRGTTDKIAMLVSNNEVEFRSPYGKSGLMIALRYEPPGAAQPGEMVLVNVASGQFDCVPECDARFKFDDGPISTWRAREPSGRFNVLVFRDNKELIAKIKASKRVVIEADFYQDGRRQFTFDTAGLKWEHGSKPQATITKWCFSLTPKHNVAGHNEFGDDEGKRVECRGTLDECESRRSELDTRGAAAVSEECVGK